MYGSNENRTKGHALYTCSYSSIMAGENFPDETWPKAKKKKRMFQKKKEDRHHPGNGRNLNARRCPSKHWYVCIYIYTLTKRGKLVTWIKRQNNDSKRHVGPEHIGPERVGLEQVGLEHVGSEYVGPEYVGPEYVGPEYVGPEYTWTSCLM